MTVKDFAVMILLFAFQRPRQNNRNFRMVDP